MRTDDRADALSRNLSLVSINAIVLIFHLALGGKQPRNVAQCDRPRPLIAQGLIDGQTLLMEASARIVQSRSPLPSCTNEGTTPSAESPRYAP